MYLRVASLTITLLLFASSVMAKPIHLQISHAAKVATPKALVTDYLIKLIAERSNGRVLPELQNKKLSPESTLLALTAGQIQVAILDLSELRQRLPQLQLFELPFLFQNRRHLQRILDGEIGRQILLSAQQQSIKPLSFWNDGFRQLLADRPLSTPEQLNGLSIGVPANKLLAAQYRLLGATPLAPGEPGHGNNIMAYDVLLSQAAQNERPKLNDLTITNHMVFGTLLLVEQRFWSQLPEDLKIIISGVIKDVTNYSRELSLQREQQLLKRWQHEGRRIHRLTPSQRKLWQEKVIDLYPRYTDKIGRHLVEMVLQG